MLGEVIHKGWFLFASSLFIKWGLELTGEFRKRIELLGLNDQAKKKVIDLLKEAGDEFPCLTCPSKDTCENFKWYLKWFNE